MFEAAATTWPGIQPGEKIRVTVYSGDRLSGEYEVDPGGYVSLPLAGTIKAAGLSKPQLEQALAKKFRGEYLKNTKVTVDVSTFRPFYILGEVGKPGEYPFKSGLNVMSAIALAGGNTYRANRSNVLIQHAGDAGFHEYPLSPSIPVQPGDLIRLPEALFLRTARCVRATPCPKWNRSSAYDSILAVFASRVAHRLDWYPQWIFADHLSRLVLRNWRHLASYALCSLLLRKVRLGVRPRA